MEVSQAERDRVNFGQKPAEFEFVYNNSVLRLFPFTGSYIANNGCVKMKIDTPAKHRSWQLTILKRWVKSLNIGGSKNG